MFETASHVFQTFLAISENISHVCKTLLDVFGSLHGLRLWYIWDLFWHAWDASRIVWVSFWNVWDPSRFIWESSLCLTPLLTKALLDSFVILPDRFKRICNVFQMLPLSLSATLPIVFETLPGIWDSSCDFLPTCLKLFQRFLIFLLMILRPYLMYLKHFLICKWLCWIVWDPFWHVWSYS